VSVVIGLIILIASVRLLRQSLTLTLDGVPEGIRINQIEELSKTDDRIIDIHHIHIWPISSTRNAMTAHVLVNDDVTIGQAEDIKLTLKEKLSKYHINHATLEIEYHGNTDCEDPPC
jgi:cobalt-zinc-cadmium efflux system protein